MSDNQFKDVYKLRDPEALRAYYDQWADSYDADTMGHGYATPDRCAAALIAVGTALNARILDFGCGTGVSGQAMRARGFTDIDGADLSAEMLVGARAKGVYRTLRHVDASDPVPAGYDVIAAVGVISVGAAPPEVLDAILSALAPGDRIVMSFNDHALADDQFPAKLDEVKAQGVAVIYDEYGPHLPGIGMKSRVYVLEK